jgi:hypothetical protein
MRPLVGNQREECVEQRTQISIFGRYWSAQHILLPNGPVPMSHVAKFPIMGKTRRTCLSFKMKPGLAMGK